MSSQEVVLQQEDIVIDDPWGSFTADTPMRMPGDSEYDEDTETSISNDEDDSENDEAISEYDKEDSERDKAGSEDDEIGSVDYSYDAVDDELVSVDDKTDPGDEESGSNDETVANEDDEPRAEILDEKDTHIMPYVSIDRGLSWSEIAEGGIIVRVPRPCNMMHLRAIRTNLKQLLTLIVLIHEQGRIDAAKLDEKGPVELEYIDPEMVYQILTATEVELSRLRRHPELFPSEGMMEDFWNDICDLNDDLIGRGLSILEDCDVDERRLFDVSVELSEDLRLHARDTNRKPWEHFLHNGAPGSGIDVSGYGNDGSVQVLPSSAMWILHAALLEYNSTVGAIEAERRADSAPHKELKDDHFFEPEPRLTDNGYTTSLHYGTQLYPELHGDAREAPSGQELENLETLNGIFGKKDNRSTVNISNTDCLGIHTQGGIRGRQVPNRWERCAIIVRQCPV
ncbi:hypothetical protein N7G274_003986 [Stereocaulon virgatum]|uniref:Uncharacterized protein n=1 Tax=Stereocaulon virgatum TaxID=373712 RepID=A0ABR4AB03_9LECA